MTTAPRGRDVLAFLVAGCDGLVELRALPSKARVFARPDDADAIAAFLTKHSHENCYFGPSTRRDDTNGSLENCRHLTTFYIDVDYKGIPEAEARARLAACPLPPSVVITTGGGLHAYWRLREPLDVRADDPKPWLQRLAAHFDADPQCAEVARVLRMPGTRNFKYHPPRPVRVETFSPEALYNPSDFDDWLPAVPTPSRAVPTNATLADPVTEGQRNALLFRVGRSLRARGVPAEAIEAALRQSNGLRCQPPLDEVELRDLLHQVLTLADRPTLAGARETAPPSPLALVPVGTLLDEDDSTETAWLVDGLLPRASFDILAGGPKGGKTTLVRTLALNVARGGTFLGRRCAQGPVWLFVFEDARADVRQKFRKLGVTPDDPIAFYFGLPNPTLLDDLHRRAIETPPALLVLDTLFRATRVKDIRDYSEVLDKLGPVLTLARDSGATVLGVVHSKKGTQLGEYGLEAVLGSQALVGSVDNILILRRTERHRLIESVQRVGTDLEPTTLVMDGETGIITLGTTRDEADTEYAARDLLAALAEHGEPITEPHWLDLVEARTRHKRQAVRFLLATGSIERTGNGKRGSPYLYHLLDSRSLVPYREREQAISLSPNSDPIKPAKPVSCSQHSVGPEVPHGIEL